MITRLFTAEQANGLLARVIPLLERLRDAHAVMEEHQETVTTMAPTNGGGAAHRAFAEAAAAAEGALEELEAIGIEVRDPSIGLIDFPSERNGETVFLCFRLGEDIIGFWHPTDTGYAGRQPL